MLKDFVKMETFLTVVRERSFSKASARLGISQPAVTQQIKHIEHYLESKIIERKKNGISLTASGEALYKVGIELERCINNAEVEILNIINKKITFRLGASLTIGNYVIPGDCLNIMSDIINNSIKLHVGVSNEIITKLKNKTLDLGIVESYTEDNALMARRWKEDELVIFSNTPIPKVLKPEELHNFRWVCREEGSNTKKIMQEVFDNIGIKCESLNIISEVSDTTAVLQTVTRSSKNSQKAVVSVISKYAIADKVREGTLFEARLQGSNMLRYFYILYHKDNKRNVYLNNAVDHILSGYC